MHRFLSAAALAVLLTIVAFSASTAQVKGLTEEFDAEWRKAQENLLASAPPVPSETVAVVRALAEAGQLRMRPYHSASNQMAAATSNDSGLFYLGRAYAHADFVEWTSKLRFPEAGEAPVVPALATELDRLEAEILEAYVPPRSIERHGDFIQLHAISKLARELDAEAYRYGALVQYLESLTRLGAMLAPDDLERMIRLALRGDEAGLKAAGVTPDTVDEITSLPAFAVTDLDGKTLTRDELRDRVVVVEFWASWCPPCLGTIKWLRDLRERHGDKIGVVALAVESPEPEVRELVEATGGDVSWALGTPGLAAAFGDVVAVPTLFVFDRDGSKATTFYGNPPDLHAQVEALVATLIE